MDTSHGDASEQDTDEEEHLGSAFQRLRMEEERLFVKLGTNPPSEDEEEEEDDDEILSSYGYDPSKPFHRWNSSLPEEEENEESESETIYVKRAISLPPASSVISALKGTREKSGDPRRVSWAPDVYDPRPNSLTYIPKKKMVTRQQVKTNKKYGKGKQKGKNARSGGGIKEKKQHHKGEDEEDDDFEPPESFGGGSSKKGKNWGKKGKNHRGNTRQFVYGEDD